MKVHTTYEPLTIMNTEPKYRRPLNNQQLQLLKTLYKFRCATTGLIAETQGAKYIRVILGRLQVLEDQGYIGKKYDSSYKIERKPASYHLLIKGIRIVKTLPGINQAAIKSLYYDRTASDEQIEHYLRVFQLYNNIKLAYPDQFKFYSKTELIGKDYVPAPIPDALLTRKKPSNTKPNDFFLDSIEQSLSYKLLISRIRKYVAFAESEAWEKKKQKDFPTLIFVCENELVQKRVSFQMKKTLDTSYADLKYKIVVRDKLIEVLR